MNRTNTITLLVLAAVWGSSFLFMRMGTAEFGPVALSEMRVLGAALVLLPLLKWQGQWQVLRTHAGPLLVVGITNSALPFLCFGYAALTITAGLASIFNAATPLFAAAIAWLWLNDRLSATRIVGLVMGFGGVLGLAWTKASVAPAGDGAAIMACLVATVFYGWSANYTKKHLSNVAPLAVAAGSQLFAAVVLALPAVWWWPARSPSYSAWVATTILAVVCTALAYVLYFRLIAHVGPAKAVTVTFLIPAFSMLWGGMFAGEEVTLAMLISGVVIALGTSLTTGLLRMKSVNMGS